MPDRTRGSVVVSVHDVCPGTLPVVRTVLAELDRLDARPRVLKVIPAGPSGRADLCPGLVDLIRSEGDAGSEIVLHGLTHHRDGPLLGPWSDRLRGRLFAPADAEFLALGAAAMRAHLEDGREILRRAGSEPAGFGPPSWLAAPGLHGVLRELGFGHCVWMAGLADLAHGRRIGTPWVGNIGAGGMQEALVGTAGRGGVRVFARAPVVKVFIHPVEAQGAGSPARALAELARLLTRRRPVTYAQLAAG